MEDKKFEIISHSLGGEKQYRNYFAADIEENNEDYKIIKECVAEGLMIAGSLVDGWDGKMQYFHVTKKGKNFYKRH